MILTLRKSNVIAILVSDANGKRHNGTAMRGEFKYNDTVIFKADSISYDSAQFILDASLIENICLN